MLHIVGSVLATIPVRCYWASFFCLNNENKATLWICRWWRTSFVSSCSCQLRGGGPHFSRNSSISGWFNRARQQSRWMFITNKWTSEIGDNSASIHGPFHRNRVTRKDNNIDYRSNHSHAGRTWSCGQYFMDRRRDNHRVQSTIDAGCLGYGCMVKNNNCHDSTNCEVRILRNYFFLVAFILMSA